MMDLVSWRSNLYEKSDNEMGFAVTCSPTHKVFLNTQVHIFYLYFMSKKMLNSIDHDGIL